MKMMVDRKKYLVLLGLISLVLLVSVGPAYSRRGQAGAAGAYLRMGIGARPLGMGGSYVAICDDAYATYWNPAGLSQIKDRQIGSMYTVMSLDRRYNFLSYTQGVGKDWRLGFSWINFGIGGIEERDDRGNFMREFESSETAYYLSLAKWIGKNLSLGGNIKFLTHNLLDNMATGFGFDVGVFFKPTEILSWGFMLQDIGSKVKWDTIYEHEDTFPLNIRCGFALKLHKDKLILATDLEKNETQPMKFHTGGEYRIIKDLVVRLGYDDGDLTAGASFRLHNFRFDYGYSTDKLREGGSHRISLLMRFGGKKLQKEAKKEEVEMSKEVTNH